MAEMVERVARALHDEWNGVGAWSSLTDRDRRRWEFMARAALAAMKITNTVEGVPGGIAFEDAFFGNDYTVFHAMASGWNATIDAALSPSPSR